MSTPERCKFFVQRKKRYCKMLVKPGQELCGEHQKPSELSVNENNTTSPLRILCPLDRKHTVYAHKLDKHLKICNARQKNPELYIQKDINSGKTEVQSSLASNDSYQMLATFPKKQVLHVIDQINSIYDKNVKLTDKRLTYPLVEKEMENNPEYGDKVKKHLKQVSSILSMLEEYKMLKEKTCYIEFGAGRGQLSYWITQATEALENAKILLIERASPKHKKDNKIATTSDRIQRIKADIADLVLDKLDVINEVENIVGVTKHLCGEATDLAIRCLTNLQVNKDKIYGAVLTFCCHHRCRWTPYTGKKFFEENNLTMNDFNIMCGLSSWATCGLGYSREYREKLKNEGHHKSVQREKDLDYNLSRTEREEIGRRCKNVINWGRLKYLEQYGFECSLHHYVDKDTTLENVCIVASRHENNNTV